MLEPVPPSLFPVEWDGNRGSNCPVKILGIDPGSYRMGFGLIEKSALGLRLLHCETIQSDRPLLEERLREIGLRLEELLNQYRPQMAAVEQVFLGKNPHSAFVLGHSRGVALYELAKFQVETFEYSPREIKKAVTGQGQASKESMGHFVREILQSSPDSSLETILESDASDALSMAIAHAQMLDARAGFGQEHEVDL